MLKNLNGFLYLTIHFVSIEYLWSLRCLFFFQIIEILSGVKMLSFKCIRQMHKLKCVFIGGGGVWGL